MKAGLATITATIGIGVAGSVQAVEINDIFLFGDSYTDTGAFVPLTNGIHGGRLPGELVRHRPRHVEEHHPVRAA